MERISATDAVFLDIEGPKSPLIIGGLFILDPATAPGSFVRHRDILDYVASRLHVAPNLRRKLIYHPIGLDEPRLIDDPNFDLEFHVRHIGLPKPRDLRQLKILASRLMSRPMDLHRPLWEMYIIEGLEEVEGAPPDAFAMLFRMHHATFDGRAAGAAMWTFMQDTPVCEPAPSPTRWEPEHKPDAIGWVVSSIEDGFKQLAANARALPPLGMALARVARSRHESKAELAASEEKEAKAPRTRFQDKITSHRVFDWVRWDMAEVQEVRAGLGKPKMNDLQVALIAGGLRRYLAKHGELPAEPLLAICPISVRGEGDPLAGGNKVLLMRVTLATDTADPLARLARIAASTAKGKNQAELLGGDFGNNLLNLAPYPLRSGVMRRMTKLADRFDLPGRVFANTMITNAPNPRGGHYFTGAEVISYAGFGPVPESMGLFHTITGMDFEVTISVTSCREILPDLPFYMQCLRESFDELHEASRLQPPAAAARPRKAHVTGTKPAGR